MCVCVCVDNIICCLKKYRVLNFSVRTYISKLG